MQIDFVQFLTQAVGLVAWVFVAAGIYAAVEKATGGPAASETVGGPAASDKQ